MVKTRTGTGVNVKAHRSLCQALHAMYDAAFAEGGFVEVIFPLPRHSADPSRPALGITAELQELRDIASVLQDEASKQAAATLDAESANFSSLPQTFETQNIHVPCCLLTRSSPMFASMLGQGWRETNERCLRVQKFSRDDFSVFLDCLYALANATVPLIRFHAALDNPQLLRKILPIAHYYQVDDLKKVIFNTVLRPESLQDKPIVEFTELVTAVESSLPEEEIPEWPMAVLQGMNVYFKRIKPKHLNNQTNEASIDDLSVKTLRNLLATPEAFDQFVDRFLRELKWDDLFKPVNATDATLKQTSSGPQHTVQVFSNSGKTIRGERTVDIPWKENLRSALRRTQKREDDRGTV